MTDADLDTERCLLRDPSRGPRVVELLRVGATITRRFGRSGATQVEVESHDDAARARQALRGQVTSLLRRGYQPGFQDDALLAAIVADPSSAGPYRVYADWLRERDDPRGEWIAGHLDAELGTPTVPLVRLAELAATRGLELLPLELERERLDARWRYGFIEGVVFPERSPRPPAAHPWWHGYEDYLQRRHEHRLATLARIRAHPSGALLSSAWFSDGCEMPLAPLLAESRS